GPHWLLTSGSREASHNLNYRADSIEIVFDASDPAYLDFLKDIQSQGSKMAQAGYISLRPSRSSRATLSMHSVAGPYAIAIEVASLHGLRDTAAWMQVVQNAAVQRGGRPHWGQTHQLNAAQVLDLYGQNVKNWRNALQRVSGSSSTFSNNFTRQRGLEPLDFERKVTAISQATDELLVIHVANQGMDDAD